MTTLTCAWPSDSRGLTAAPGQAGMGLAPEQGALRERLRAAIAQQGGWIDRPVDHTGWVVTLSLPQEQIFTAPTLEDGLNACLAWLVTLAAPAEVVAG